MAPLFCEGDEVKITRVKLTELRTGEILALMKHDTYLAHRLMHIINEGGQTQLITKGDRLLAADKPHQLTDVLGVVVARRRKGQNLDFERGKGRWLARAIARLNVLEAQLMNRKEIEGYTLMTDAVPGPTDMRLTHRTIRWLVYRLSQILLKLTDLLP